MNAKYTSKPKEIPNEPNLFGFVRVIPATCHVVVQRRRKAGIQIFSCLQKNEKSKSCLSCKSCLKNNP
jgi:hypothetical protein